jgi:hypothetical protein
MQYEVHQTEYLCMFLTCSCLSVFVTISCFGLVVNYGEFPYCLSSVGSGAQMYSPSSLLGSY